MRKPVKEVEARVPKPKVEVTDRGNDKVVVPIEEDAIVNTINTPNILLGASTST